jgi:hypothetical protein
VIGLVTGFKRIGLYGHGENSSTRMRIGISYGESGRLPTPKNIDRRRPALKIIDGATSLFHRRFLGATSF